MENVYYNCVTQTRQTSLRHPKSLLTHSSSKHPCKSTNIYCGRTANILHQKIPTSTTAPLWWKTGPDDHRCHARAHTQDKGSLAQEESGVSIISRHRRSLPKCCQREASPKHEKTQSPHKNDSVHSKSPPEPHNKAQIRRLHLRRDPLKQWHRARRPDLNGTVSILQRRLTGYPKQQE